MELRFHPVCLRPLGIMSVSHENWPLQELLVGVETPILPIMMDSAAPKYLKAPLAFFYGFQHLE
jgi:hypothetical protein